jgi:hypothetical protein
MCCCRKEIFLKIYFFFVLKNYTLLLLMGGDEGTLGVDNLAVGTILLDAALLLELQVLSALDASETPDAGDVDLLTSRILELGTAEALNSMGDVLLEGTDGHEDLSDVNTGDEAIRLTEGTTHTSLETIGSGAGQHLVDTQDVEGVGAHTQMETILTAHLHGILVGADTGSLKSLRGDVLVFAGDQMDSEGELINSSLLLTAVIDTKLRVGDSAAEAGLGVRLVLDEAIAEMIGVQMKKKQSWVSELLLGLGPTNGKWNCRIRSTKDKQKVLGFHKILLPPFTYQRAGRLPILDVYQTILHNNTKSNGKSKSVSTQLPKTSHEFYRHSPSFLGQQLHSSTKLGPILPLLHRILPQFELETAPEAKKRRYTTFGTASGNSVVILRAKVQNHFQ